jgi:NAD(P)-dependent dehydrogenase (short-subunit alcohol dehydrogenase family)
MVKSISEAVIVITGASSGIGRATALAAAAQKASVVVASRQEAALNEVVQECERLGGKALAVRADVTDEKQVLHLAAKAIDRFGRIDAWVNAAAVTLLSGFEDAPSDVFRRVVETNFFGYVHGARAALAQFRGQGKGVLINISSVLGKTGAPYSSAYSASKFAIAGFSESLRMELRSTPGIHVCTVFPATVDTPLFQHAANYTGRAVAAPPPVYQPEEVAAAILRCVTRPVREVTVGNVRRTIAMRSVAPGLAERTYSSKVHREHFLNRPAPASHGNLFDPMPAYNTVHGGWSRGPNSKRALWLSAAFMVAGIGAAVVYLSRRTPQVVAISKWCELARTGSLSERQRTQPQKLRTAGKGFVRRTKAKAELGRAWR